MLPVDGSESSHTPSTEMTEPAGDEQTPDQPQGSLLSADISILSLSPAFVASLAVCTAALVGSWWLTLTLAVLALALAVLGILLTRSRGRLISSAGALLSAAILVVMFIQPALLNPFWTASSPAPELYEFAAVPRTKTRGPGIPLQATDWVNAEKDGIRQGDLFIQLQSVKAGQLPDKGAANYLLVNLRIDQMRDGQSHQYERFAKGAREPKLVDETGREYAFIADRVRKLPSKFDRLFVVDQLVIFELPQKFQALNLTLPASIWGGSGECRFRISEVINEPTPDMTKLIAETKAMLRRPSPHLPDRALGRAVFAKNCQECHTLFGTGGKTGPDLTASKRSDLDFLLTSIIDPSAVIEKKYQPTLVITTNGIVHNGIVQKEDAETLTLLVPSKLIVVPKSEIEERRNSNISIMPTELLKGLTEIQVRSLIAYLMGSSQSPMLASKENVGHFFPPAEDLSNWHANGAAWKAEKGVVLAPEAVSGKASQLIGDLIVADDCHMTLRFNPGKNGRGAVLIADEGKADSPNTIRVELNADQPIVLKCQAATRSPGEPLAIVKPDSWNKLEIALEAGRIDVRLNDLQSIRATGVAIPPRRMFVLEGPNESGREMRFRTLSIQLLGLAE